LTKNNHLII